MWTLDEVSQWLQELGPWAEEKLVPTFRYHGIGESNERSRTGALLKLDITA